MGILAPRHDLRLDAQAAAEGHRTRPAMSTAAHAAAGRRPPSVLREIVYGMSLGLFAGYLWKLHHWSNQRRTREFYSLLDQGKVSVVADEPRAGADDD
jgi:hypothetical protein